MDVDLPKLLEAFRRIGPAIWVAIGNPNLSDNPVGIGNPNISVGIGNPDISPIGIGNPNLHPGWYYWSRPVRVWPWLQPPPPPPPPMAMVGGFDPQPDPPGRRVGFDPQPDPPGRALQLASAIVAHQIAMSAVTADASGVEGGATRVVSRAVDSWCGTKPSNLPIPWPTPWPFPWSTGYPGPDAYPGPDNIYPGPDGVRLFEADTRIVGALTLASVTSGLPEGDVRDAMTEGSERLLRTALSD